MTDYIDHAAEVARIRSSFSLSDATRDRLPGFVWQNIVTVEDFDRMLAEVVRAAKEEAWDEGWNTAVVFMDGPDWAEAPDNPYARKESSDG